MDEEEDVIPLPNVNSAILKKVNITIIFFLNTTKRLISTHVLWFIDYNLLF